MLDFLKKNGFPFELRVNYEVTVDQYVETLNSFQGF